MGLPPIANRVIGKGASVMGRANLDVASVMSKVIEAMGDSFSVRKRRPVMVIDPNCLLCIGVPFPIELTD